MSGFNQKIYALIAQIPAGKVLTYGTAAFLCGFPRAARRAGSALRAAPDGLPCHRVVKADGRLAPAAAFSGESQRRLLEAEGVAFNADGRVDLVLCLWRPG